MKVVRSKTVAGGRRERHAGQDRAVSSGSSQAAGTLEMSDAGGSAAEPCKSRPDGFGPSCSLLFRRLLWRLAASGEYVAQGTSLLDSEICGGAA